MSETTNTKAPKKVVGNKTTEIIIGAAATKLMTGITALTAAVSEVEKLEERVQKGTLEVVNLEDKIGALQQDLVNKTAQNKIEIGQQYKADQKAFVDQWLNENSLITVSESDWNSLNSQLSEATINVEAKIEAAVKAEKSAAAASLANQLKIKDLEHQNKEAANVAEIAQLKTQNAFLVQQAENWKQMLENQAKQETERAKYGQINTLNVGNPNAGR